MTAGGSRGNRPLQTGVVVSDKMEKTIVVVVENLQKHPKYEKYVRRRTRRHVHDEKGEAKVGDLVEIAPTRRLSRLKRWRLVRVVRSGGLAEAK